MITQKIKTMLTVAALACAGQLFAAEKLEPVGIGCDGVVTRDTPDGTKYTLEYSGSTKNGDNLLFASEEFGNEENVCITARLDMLESDVAEAKAGVIVRNGLESGAANVFLFHTPNHAGWGSRQWRHTAIQILDKKSNGPRHRWVKLLKNERIVRLYTSADGRKWDLVRVDGWYDKRNVRIGLFVTSGTDKTAKARFSNVSIEKVSVNFTLQDITPVAKHIGPRTSHINSNFENAKRFFVSTRGSDSNSGTEKKPFATLEAARNAIRALPLNERRRPQVVTLKEGTYTLNKTFLLKPHDSGSAQAPVIYRGEPGKKVVVQSGEKLGRWQRLKEELPTLPEKAKGHIWYTDIPKGKKFFNLYIDGELQRIAEKHWPAKGDIKKSGPFHGDWSNWDQIKSVDSPTSKGRRAVFPDGILDGLPDNDDVMININYAVWWNSFTILRQINSQDNSAYLHTKNPIQFDNKIVPFLDYQGGYFNILNALKYLDAPGEWVLDSKKGRIYIWPKGDTMLGKSVQLPNLYELVYLQGDGEKQNWEKQVSHIRFDNLSFCYTDFMPEDQWPDHWLKRGGESPDAAIFSEGAQSITIENCRFYNLANNAVTFHQYAQDCRVVKNEMFDLGGGGVQLLGYGPGKVDVNHHNEVARNYIHNIGKSYRHSGGIHIFGAGKNHIWGNVIQNTPYTAILIVGAKQLELRMADASHELFNEIMNVHDAYGNSDALYKIRHKEICGQIGERDPKRFLHSDNNMVEYNICADIMQVLGDGGSLYSWSSGRHNIWQKNLLRDRSNRGLRPIYMDDDIEDHTVCKNVIWSPNDIGRILTFTKVYDNQRTWPGKPSRYGTLASEIKCAVEDKGGWPDILTKEVSEIIGHNLDTRFLLENCLVPSKAVGESSKGLTGEYFASLDLTGKPFATRVDKHINFERQPGGKDAFFRSLVSIRWTGTIEPPTSGSYKFYFTCDDGMRVWLNGRAVMDDWNNGPARTKEFDYRMVKGEPVNIKIEYYDSGGGAAAKFGWITPNDK